MSQHKQDVHGHTVLGEDEAMSGINYLDHKLDYKEAEVFFNSARNKGSVQFEDDGGRNFTLKRNSDGTYTVEKRKSSGWWPF